MRASLWWWMTFLAGCGTSSGPYPYLVLNDDCLCQFYQLRDGEATVAYSFHATYSINESVSTSITISIQNDNRDTLDLSLAYVRVSSRNIPYRYNGKPLPVTVTSVPPRAQRTLTLQGGSEESGENDPWLAIAGEELVVTIEGMRINQKQIADQTVRFVPHNPRLSP